MKKEFGDYQTWDLDNSRQGQWYYDCIYVEDDFYERKYWRMVAEKNKINLLILKSTNDFKKHLKNISKTDTMIYLDCDLGKGEMRGDEFAKVLHEQGYQNICMVTHYDASKFAHLPWLNYMSKGCPYSEDYK